MSELLFEDSYIIVGPFASKFGVVDDFYFVSCCVPKFVCDEAQSKHRHDK